MLARRTLVAICLLNGFQCGLAYDLGEDVTLCWKTNTATGVRVREDCDGAYMEFSNLAALPETLASATEYEVTYKQVVPDSRSPDGTIPHANIHSCLRDVGFCTPFVANQPGLATHSAALKGTFSNGVEQFTSQVKLDPGQYTVIAHGRWFDTAGDKHDMARATIRDVAAPATATYISIALGVVLLMIACLGTFAFVRYAVRRFRALVAKEQRDFDRRLKRVHRVCKDADVIAFPMNVVTYADFKSHGKLVTHEVARAAHQLKTFDVASEVADASTDLDVIFVSHQWKQKPGTAQVPDPTGADYAAIVAAIDALIASGKTTAARAVLWIDYTSIPQRSRACQLLSIASLPAYTAHAKFFLIVAPSVNFNGDIFDLSSYQRRGWCRLEQWARVSQKGSEAMYICEGAQPRDVSDDVATLASCMEYLNGEFTVYDDRIALVDASVALYYLITASEKKGSLSPTEKALAAQARANRDTLFKVEFFEDMMAIVDEEVAQGQATFKMKDATRRASHQMRAGSSAKAMVADVQDKKKEAASGGPVQKGLVVGKTPTTADGATGLQVV